VFRCLGVSPKCGRCVRNIQSLFDGEARPEARLGPPAAPRAERVRLRVVQAAE
jgi:hypothetical protein